MGILSSAFSFPLFRGFYADKSSSCPFELEGTKLERKRLAALADRIGGSSAFGRELMKKGAEQGYSLSFEYIRNIRGCADSDERRIILNPSFSDKVLVATLAHEMRHAEQFANGAAEDYGVSCASRLKKNRLMEADAVAASVLICFDLDRAGDKAPLAALKTNYPRIVAAYERKEEEGANKALTAAALAWYDEEETKFSYELNDFIEPLSDGEGLKPDSERRRDMSSEELIGIVCRGNYFSEPPSVLDVPARAGISEISAAWLDLHLKVCGERGVRDGEIDPTLKSIAVHPSTRFMKNAAHAFYPFPEPLSERGELRAVRIEAKRQPPAALLLSRGSQKSR